MEAFYNKYDLLLNLQPTALIISNSAYTSNNYVADCEALFLVSMETLYTILSPYEGMILSLDGDIL
jgi:hypothetical protein